MEKLITVAHLPHGLAHHVRIPVHYRIEKPHENAINLHCSIRTAEEERPEWLGLSDFIISKDYSRGVTCTHYSGVPLHSIQEGGLAELIATNVRLADPEYRDWEGS